MTMVVVWRGGSHPASHVQQSRLIYLMPPYVIVAEDLRRLTDAIGRGLDTLA